MRLLLDTHALIWWWMDDPALPLAARAAMEDRGNETFVSAVTALELATKIRKGQLVELREHLSAFRNTVEADGFRLLNIVAEHGVQGGSMPGTHKDPFDYLLAAQAIREGLIVITRDREIAAFGCEVLW